MTIELLISLIVAWLSGDAAGIVAIILGILGLA